MSDLSKLQKFLNDSYRGSYLESHVKGSIAYQIQALREKEDINQTKFGKLIGKPQSIVSRLENTEYGGVNINTLLQIAHALKIGLEVKFCNFETILKADVSPAAFKVETIHETLLRLLAHAAPTPPANIVASVSAKPQNIEGYHTWQTDPLPNQPQTHPFPGSGTHSFERSTPIHALQG